METKLQTQDNHISQNGRPVILVVDDEVGPRESLRLILTPDYTVEMASNGREAVDLFDRLSPDVVLSDIRMPTMDGIQLMKTIRERSADVPFILITGYASLDSAKEAVRAGAFDYINKPYNVSDIRDIVARALRSRKEGRETEAMMNRLQKTNDELEEHIRDMNQRATVGDLSAEVIHDLNNPICVLQGYVELLDYSMERQPGHKDSEEHELLETIKQQAHRCIDLTRNFLNYAQPSGEAYRGSVDVNQLLAETLQLFQTRFRHLNIEAETECVDQNLAVCGDPVTLQQVFYNLISNACQAMQSHERQPHTLRISTHAAAAEDGAPTVIVAIADNGPGIPRDIQDKIFDRFFTTKPKDEGTGLGLAIANRIVTAHEGALTLESTPGEGTTFTITLPAR